MEDLVAKITISEPDLPLFKLNLRRQLLSWVIKLIVLKLSKMIWYNKLKKIKFFKKKSRMKSKSQKGMNLKSFQ